LKIGELNFIFGKTVDNGKNVAIAISEIQTMREQECSDCEKRVVTLIELKNGDVLGVEGAFVDLLLDPTAHIEVHTGESQLIH